MPVLQEIIRSSKSLEYTLNQPDSVWIEDVVTGKRFEVTKGVYKILKFLEQPQSVNDFVQTAKKQFEESAIYKTLNYLYDNKLVVPNHTDDTLKVVAKKPPVFGLNQTQDPKQLEDSVIFIGVPYGSGNTKDDNCKLFPYFLRAFTQKYGLSLNKQNISKINFNFIDHAINFSSLIERCQDEKIVDFGELYFWKIESAFSVYDKIELVVEASSKNGNIPFVLGGDHSISYPAIKGISKNYDTFQIVHFDAHTDTYYSKIQELYEKSGKAAHHHGNFISKCLELKNLKKVTQIGIRGVPNAKMYQHEKIEVIWMNEVQELLENGTEAILKDVPIYITFDIDYFDPSIAPGTATPVLEGAYFNNTVKLLKSILDKRPIIGFDLVEVNPNIDIEEPVSYTHLTLPTKA